MKYVVYILKRPDGSPFYVGKGRPERPHGHLDQAKKGSDLHRHRIIRKIWAEGGEPIIEIALSTDNENEAYEMEKRLIAQIGRPPLVNQTDGGIGGTGKKLSSEHIRKIRLATIEAMKDPARRETSRLAGKKGGAAGRGKKKSPRSPESNAKISARLKGVSKSESHCKSISESAKKRRFKPGSRASQGESLQRYWQDVREGRRQRNAKSPEKMAPESFVKTWETRRERYGPSGRRSKEKSS